MVFQYTCTCTCICCRLHVCMPCSYNFITIVSKLHSADESRCMDHTLSVYRRWDGCSYDDDYCVPWYQIFVTPDAANRYSFVTPMFTLYSYYT